MKPRNKPEHYYFKVIAAVEYGYLGNKIEKTVYYLNLFIGIFSIILALSMLEKNTVTDFSYLNWFSFFELFFITFFFLEYLIKILGSPFLSNEKPAKARIKYIFSFFGIIDFLVCIPSILIFLYFDSSLNLFFFLRFIRMLKLVRFIKGYRFIYQAFSKNRSLFFTLFSIQIFILLSLVTLVYLLENTETQKLSIFDSFWFSTITLTTIGFGDFVPNLQITKLVVSIFAFFGILIWAIPISLISVMFFDTFKKNMQSEYYSELIYNLYEDNVDIETIQAMVQLSQIIAIKNKEIYYLNSSSDIGYYIVNDGKMKIGDIKIKLTGNRYDAFLISTLKDKKNKINYKKITAQSDACIMYFSISEYHYLITRFDKLQNSFKTPKLI